VSLFTVEIVMFERSIKQRVNTVIRPKKEDMFLLIPADIPGKYTRFRFQGVIWTSGPDLIFFISLLAVTAVTAVCTRVFRGFHFPPQLTLTSPYAEMG